MNVAERKSAILAMLVEAVNTGQPCPTDQMMVERLGCGRKEICWPLRSLAIDGAIQVESIPPFRRRIRIVAIDRWTLWTEAYARGLPDPNVSPFPYDTLAIERAERELERRRVNRDPCPYCAIRADIGCEHQKVAA